MPPRCSRLIFSPKISSSSTVIAEQRGGITNIILTPSSKAEPSTPKIMIIPDSFTISAFLSSSRCGWNPVSGVLLCSHCCPKDLGLLYWSTHQLIRLINHSIELLFARCDLLKDGIVCTLRLKLERFSNTFFFLKQNLEAAIENSADHTKQKYFFHYIYRAPTRCTNLEILLVYR